MKQQVERYKDIVKKLNAKEYAVFRSILGDASISEEKIKDLDIYFAEKGMEMKPTTAIKQKSLIERIYSEPLNKLERVFWRGDILEKIGGLKVLLYGKTGTGKTSFVKYLKERNKKIPFISMNLEEIISSKMGQTQINLFKLATKFENIEKPTILFIDELDSIVGNRKSEDLGERKKIASTFLKFLDSLNKNMILISATNYSEDIDPAILRRFNFKIQGYEISAVDAIGFIDEILGTSMFRKKTMFKKTITKKFTISDIYSFANHINIEREFVKEVDVYKEFMIMFEQKFSNILEFDERRGMEINNAKY